MHQLMAGIPLFNVWKSKYHRGGWRQNTKLCKEKGDHSCHGLGLEDRGHMRWGSENGKRLGSEGLSWLWKEGLLLYVDYIYWRRSQNLLGRSWSQIIAISSIFLHRGITCKFSKESVLGRVLYTVHFLRGAVLWDEIPSLNSMYKFYDLLFSWIVCLRVCCIVIKMNGCQLEKMMYSGWFLRLTNKNLCTMKAWR